MAGFTETLFSKVAVRTQVPRVKVIVYVAWLSG